MDIEPQMSLTFITQYFPPDFAPTGQFIEDIAVYLAEKGFNVRVFTSKPGYAYSKNKKNCPKKEIYKGVEIVRTNSVNFLSERIRGKALTAIAFCLRTIVEIMFMRRKEEIMVLTSAPPFLVLVGLLCKLLFHQRYICIIYDIYPELIVRLGILKSTNWIVKIWKWCNNYALRCAEKIVVLTQDMKKVITSEILELDDKVWIIPTWADGDQILPIDKKDNDFAKTHSLQNYFTILYSGNLGRCHDSLSILEMAKLLKDKPYIKIVLIGGGIGRKIFETEIRQGNLNNVILLPYQEKEILPLSLTACDVSIISLKQGFEDLVAPSKLYGMLAAGTPIIAFCSPNSYISKIINDCDCGRAFCKEEVSKSVQYIDYLLNYPEELTRLGKNARKCFDDRFTFNHSMAKFTDMLNSF